MAIDFKKLPKFADLPVKAGAPADSTWGLWGEDDELGCVNMLSAEGIAKAAKLVKRGKMFRLDTPINYANPPLFGRSRAHHQVVRFEQFLAQDDTLDGYNTQEGAQWDGLSHMGYPPAQAFYNGVKRDDIKAGPEGKLGIDKWKDRIAGRGVLLDVFKYRQDAGSPLNPGAAEEYAVDDLEGARRAQGVEFEGGDILLVRTGWLEYYMNLPQSEKNKMGSMEGMTACGLSNARETVEWLWNNHVAMLGTDCPAVETWPWQDFETEALHYRTLALLGLPIGEQFILADLAADCHADGVYEFMITSAPLNLPGAVASPPNALAIK